MSFHHMAAIVAVRRIVVIMGILVFLFIMIIVDKVRDRALVEAMIGHGLSFTKWKGFSFLGVGKRLGVTLIGFIVIFII